MDRPSRARALLASLGLAFGCGGAPSPRPFDGAAATPRVTDAPSPSDGERAPKDALAFEIADGQVQNLFYRRGPIAAHALATSGSKPRLLFAFPAGNMGVGLWFGAEQGAVALTLRGGLRERERPGGLRGVTAELHAKSRTLRAERIALASVRVLRGVDAGEPLPEAMRATRAPGSSIVLQRTTLGGHHHLELHVEPMAGTLARVEADGALTLEATGDAVAVAARLTALSDDAPLTPVAPEALLSPAAAPDPRLREVLAFLAYREKLLAGSWHYLTYFGRDTLLTTRLLLPVLRPEAVEAALGSVLERLSPEGEVAHEEEVGEFAVASNLSAGAPAARATPPRYDYKMVDDDFLLPAVLADYLDTEAGRARAAAFFARTTSSGRTYAEAVRQNLARVVKQATPFAARPSARALVAIERGLNVGNWRDSEKGLAGGLYPYDVNVALVPAALAAAGRLGGERLNDAALAAEAERLARAWTHTERFFRVAVPAAEAKRRIAGYARELGIGADEALAAVDGPVVLRAVSLDAKGAPVPVMHSDDGFVMLFGAPDAPFLEEIAARIERPFPLGLRTPVGVVVANPALAPDAKTRAVLGRKDYHGTVVWSWQQALLAAGLQRQRARADLPAATLDALERAEASLWSVITATRDAASAELWSFRIEDGRFVRIPFGQESGHDEESNAAQLWSTVYLGVQPRR